MRYRYHLLQSSRQPTGDLARLDRQETEARKVSSLTLESRRGWIETKAHTTSKSDLFLPFSLTKQNKNTSSPTIGLCPYYFTSLV